MNKKVVLLIGIITYAILLLFSVFFFKERTVFLDVAFHIFQIVKTGDFTIQAGRFGAALTQIFPLASAKVGLPI